MMGTLPSLLLQGSNQRTCTHYLLGWMFLELKGFWSFLPYFGKWTESKCYLNRRQDTQQIVPGPHLGARAAVADFPLCPQIKTKDPKPCFTLQWLIKLNRHTEGNPLPHFKRRCSMYTEPPLSGVWRWILLPETKFTSGILMDDAMPWYARVAKCHNPLKTASVLIILTLV